MINQITYLLIRKCIILTLHLLTKKKIYSITIIDNLNNNFERIIKKRDFYGRI